MFKIRFEDIRGFAFSDAEKIATTNAARIVSQRSLQAVTFPRAEMIEWFGSADDATLKENLTRMNLVVQDAVRTVTFVQASGLDLRVDYNPLNALAPPTLWPPTKPNNPADRGAFYGLAYPVDATKLGESMTKGHVGSGMRIYLGRAYFSEGYTSLERPQTIYHELSHKVLATNDHVYGSDKCRALARSNSAEAITNADNYGYFLVNLP